MLTIRIIACLPFTGLIPLTAHTVPIPRILPIAHIIPDLPRVRIHQAIRLLQAIRQVDHYLYIRPPKTLTPQQATVFMAHLTVQAHPIITC